MIAFNTNTARNLCDCAADTYSDRTEIEDWVGDITDSATDTLVRIWFVDNKWIIAFRGTRDLRNWLTDADCAYYFFATARVHRGFYRAVEAVMEQVIRTLASGPADARMYLTGHSLGGALAMLFAWCWAEKFTNVLIDGVCTFGQPRVGDSGFRDVYGYCGLRAKTFRVIHANDLVPRVPWLLGAYRHAGREIFYPTTGNTFAGEAYLEDCPAFRKLPFDLRNAWRELRRGQVALLADHHVSTYQALFQGKDASPSGAGPRVPGESLAETPGSGASEQSHPANSTKCRYCGADFSGDI